MSPTGVTWLGIGVNLVLGALKVTVGLATGAQALVADGLHSISDLLTDAAVLAGLHISARPADSDHHYGHRRVTTLVTLGIGAVLLLSAAWIVYRAVATYGEPHTFNHVEVALWVAVLSIAPKEFLYRVTHAVGVRSGDTSLIANAWHHRTDAFTSVAAAAGLAGVTFGGPEWAFLDHITAVVLAAFLAVAAVKFIHESLGELTDGAPDPSVQRCLEKTIADTPGVAEFHALRVRRLAGTLTLDVHVLVDPGLSVVAGHDLATAVRRRLLDCGCSVVEAVVHVEPHFGAEPSRGNADDE
ncbi:MAG: cation diffusion facilitator family transporter [Candidatus Eisenbacteria bacterium]